MTISSIKSYQQPNFRSYYGNYSSKSTVQRVAVGSSSVLLPGLGQVVNGEYAKGAAFFLATALNLVCFRRSSHKTIGSVINWGIRGIAAYDAYKHS